MAFSTNTKNAPPIPATSRNKWNNTILIEIGANNTKAKGTHFFNNSKAPIKTSKGWLHLAHGVRNTAAGLRYTLYMFMTDLQDISKVIHTPAGHFMAPENQERIGDVSNVLFSNGWIADDNGKVYIYYASSDTRMHVAVSDVERLADYVMNSPEDQFTTAASVQTIINLIDHNKKFL